MRTLNPFLFGLVFALLAYVSYTSLKDEPIFQKSGIVLEKYHYPKHRGHSYNVENGAAMCDLEPGNNRVFEVASIETQVDEQFMLKIVINRRGDTLIIPVSRETWLTNHPHQYFRGQILQESVNW